MKVLNVDCSGKEIINHHQKMYKIVCIILDIPYTG